MVDTPSFDEIYSEDRMLDACRKLHGKPILDANTMLDVAKRLHKAKIDTGVHWETLGKAIGISSLSSRISEWLHGRSIPVEAMSKIKAFLDDK